MKIYTKTGDDGTTGLLGANRVSKADPRIEAYGTVDELNAALGIAKANGLEHGIDTMVIRVQEELFDIGAALADASVESVFQNRVGDDQIVRLEREIDAFETELEPLTNFILPGGSISSAQIHLARAICRRAERLVVELNRTPGQTPRPLVLVYLNRLSDWLFVVARAVNRRQGVRDIPWKGE